jgi:hypothetical protein
MFSHLTITIMKISNTFARNQFLFLARKLRAEGSITLRREKLGGCDCVVAHLNGTLDHVALYKGVMGHLNVACGFTR